jgi:hypothetical protein
MRVEQVNCHVGPSARAPKPGHPQRDRADYLVANGRRRKNLMSRIAPASDVSPASTAMVRRLAARDDGEGRCKHAGDDG